MTTGADNTLYRLPAFLCQGVMAVPPATTPKRTKTSKQLISLSPNLCAFAALRDIFLPSLAICLESVNMVLRTFRYGFYKPAYAVESG